MREKEFMIYCRDCDGLMENITCVTWLCKKCHLFCRISYKQAEKVVAL